MNLREALGQNVRQMISDMDGENWTDSRLLEAMLYSIREMRHRLMGVNRDWFTDVAHLTDADLVDVDTMTVWDLPTYVERVTGVFTDSDLQCKIPYKQAKHRTYTGTTWMMLPSFRRRFAVTGGMSEIYVQYLPQVPALHFGTVSAVGADNLTLLPTAGRQSMWENAYRGWPLQITGPTNAAAGVVYQPEESVYTPGGVPDTTVTMNEPLAAPLPAEDDEYALMLPWDGRMDEALCMLCSYRILVAEGHRRQAAEIQGMLTVALDDFTRAGMFEGDDTGGVVEDVNG